MQIILDVPDRIGEKLKALGDRLPEVLDRMLDQMPSDNISSFQDDWVRLAKANVYQKIHSVS